MPQRPDDGGDKKTWSKKCRVAFTAQTTNREQQSLALSEHAREGCFLAAKIGENHNRENMASFAGHR